MRIPDPAAFLILTVCTAAAFAQPVIEVPEGYTVEPVAGPPLVHYPMMAGFDERGRLFVAETAGLNLNRKELEEQLPGFITMLQDTDGDGKFDKATRFADKLTFPQGALWHEGALYVAASGGVWRLEDADGDGVAEKRDLLVSQFGYTGNAADIHGCFLHPDGRIYFVQGRHGHEVRDAEGQLISQSKAGGVFSIRPDGSDFHRHATGGFDNPVELIFTDEGEPLGTVNIFEHHPRRDTLVHWVEGGLYPRTDFVKQWDEFVGTGDLLPSVISLGHVAVSGLTRSSIDGSVYVTLFNTHEVRRVELSRDGATFAATQSRFLTSKNPDFHPTDVLEDADGSLLVIDTGGWFRIGCPTSQTAKPQVHGAIYRIRRIDAAKVDDPRGLKLDWDGACAAELIKRLDDRRPAVRERATATLARHSHILKNVRMSRMAELDEAVARGDSPRLRRNAVWTLTRIGGPEAAQSARAGLDDEDESVRQTAAHAAGVLHDAAAARRLQAMLIADEPPIRREAATALGLIGRSDSVTPLLESLTVNADTFTKHAVIHSLIRIADPRATEAGLAHDNPAVRRGALIALDRMSTEHLQPHHVIAALQTEDVELKAVAMEVLTRRPHWSKQAAEVLAAWLSRPRLSDREMSLAQDLLRAFIAQPVVAELVGARLGEPGTAKATRLMLLETLSEYGSTEPPASVVISLGAALNEEDAELLWSAVRATWRIAGDALDVRLVAIADADAVEPRTRVAALRSLAARGRSLDTAGFTLLLDELHPARSLLSRRDAAQVIALAKLDASQLQALIAVVRNAGPIELPLLLEAFERPEKVEASEDLFVALGESPGLPAIELKRLQQLAKRLGPSAASTADPLLARLRGEATSQKARLDELDRSLTGGHVETGKKIFFTKGTCFVCHRVAGEGGVIGPDLSTIGAIRTRRDLLEAVAFPSASFARGYEPMTVQRKDGQSFFGRITSETQDAITLADPQGVEQRIPRDKIESLRNSQFSLMPPGLERLLTPQELSDLMEYLGSLK